MKRIVNAAVLRKLTEESSKELAIFFPIPGRCPVYIRIDRLSWLAPYQLLSISKHQVLQVVGNGKELREGREI